MSVRNSLAALGILLASLFLVSPAAAVVGPTLDGATLDPHVVMVLERGPRGAGFCTGVVVAPDVVLTAAHCVAHAGDTRVHFRDTDGQPVLLPVKEVTANPGYRPDAVRRRERSVDLALVRLAAPLPGRFAPADLDADGTPIVVGQRFHLAGYGLAHEDSPATGGVLRVAALAARAPLSTVLLWSNDASGRGAGACTGDSGAPVFSEDDKTVVAITSWAAGVGAKHCGDLTQAVLLAPHAAWIRQILRTWQRQ